ncbi:MAG: tRNA modification GTPase [Planctomycetaceae bacterium]|nr:tRNA modification GTPase [Planctomycetaceae bacterium]
MIPPIDDTITAQASARGAAWRGIVRISGPDSVTLVQRRFRIPVDDSGGNHTPTAPFRHFEAEKRPCIANGELTVWGDDLPVPCTLYYWPEGRGLTGQQAVELHTIGSQPLLDAILRTLCESGCRLAGPGEFTLRAFLSGRFDLPQAEAVLGIIDADDHKQLEVALRQLAGGIGRPLAALRERLLEMTCHLEAEFDFADEEIEFLDRDLLRRELEASLRMIEQTQQQMQRRTSTSERPVVVLIGRPNAGKSSLFNAMVKLAAGSSGRPMIHGNPPSVISAIVSPQPGTTRDRLEAELQVGELQVTLLDTAGIEAVETGGNDQPRQLAQAVTHDAIEQAKLVLLCVETGEPFAEPEQAFLRENAERTLVILTKSDLANSNTQTSDFRLQTSGGCSGCQPRSPKSEIRSLIETSAIAGEGLQQLLDAIHTRLQRSHTCSEVVPATALRCRESLMHAAESLRNALQLSEASGDDLLVVTEMRIALEHIGQMTGAVHNDEILDRIFSRFCIGK